VSICFANVIEESEIALAASKIHGIEDRAQPLLYFLVLFDNVFHHSGRWGISPVLVDFYLVSTNMRVLKGLTIKLLCTGLVVASSLTSAVSVDAFAATSVSKKQEQARTHQRKKAGKLTQNSTKSSSNRKAVKTSSKSKNTACASRMSRSTSRARCEYTPTKNISAFK
jgi:hypothetical protein